MRDTSKEYDSVTVRELTSPLWGILCSALLYAVVASGQSSVLVAACTSSPSEPGEGGTRWNANQTATDSRSGVDLVISYDASG